MLKSLSISNFAVIDQIDIDLDSGMTALTGETGAGKSILLDALGLVLGDRADSGSVRNGAKRADISATFEINGLVDVQHWLETQELDTGQDCILRRTVNADGGSKGYINNTPVTLQMLRSAGEMLVDIHGQHEHQSLLKRDAQRQRLDAYGNHDSLLAELATCHQRWREAHEQLQQLQAAEQDRSERLDMLRYQVQEFDALQLTDNEWSGLEEEHKRLAHAGRLTEAVHLAQHALYDDDNALHSILSRHSQQLSELAGIDHALSAVSESLNTSLIHLDEAAEQLRHYLAELNPDPGRLEWLEQRMGTLHELARKHRTEPEKLADIEQTVRRDLDNLEHADERLQSLENNCRQYRDEYLQCAKKLSKHRQQAATKLFSAVTDAMQTLGMAGGRLDIPVTEKSHDPETGSGFSAAGLDSIEFQVSTNPGQALRPLGKVASGGELARISLAIQMITSDNEPVPTLIFDEVDAGIGGGIAEIVGMHLRRLGEQPGGKAKMQRQVMCVTHLPQVAAQAHRHLRVNKLSGDKVHTQIQLLDEHERISEVARMLGGVEITEKTRSHAQEMISRAGTQIKESA